MPSFTPYSSALSFMYLSHELFGFDIMLESNCKPFLIEVNISPSLASSSPLDRDIKGWAAASKNFHTPPRLPFCPTCLLFTLLFVPFNLQDGFSGTCLILLGFTHRRYGPTQCQTALHRSWASQRRCSRHGGTVVRFWLRKTVLSERRLRALRCKRLTGVSLRRFLLNRVQGPRTTASISFPEKN